MILLSLLFVLLPTVLELAGQGHSSSLISLLTSSERKVGHLEGKQLQFLFLVYGRKVLVKTAREGKLNAKNSQKAGLKTPTFSTFAREQT